MNKIMNSKSILYSLTDKSKNEGNNINKNLSIFSTSLIKQFLRVSLNKPREVLLKRANCIKKEFIKETHLPKGDFIQISGFVNVNEDWKSIKLFLPLPLALQIDKTFGLLRSLLGEEEKVEVNETSIMFTESFFKGVLNTLRIKVFNSSYDLEMDETKIITIDKQNLFLHLFRFELEFGDKIFDFYMISDMHYKLIEQDEIYNSISNELENQKNQVPKVHNIIQPKKAKIMKLLYDNDWRFIGEKSKLKPAYWKGKFYIGDAFICDLEMNDQVLSELYYDMNENVKTYVNTMYKRLTKEVNWDKDEETKDLCDNFTFGVNILDIAYEMQEGYSIVYIQTKEDFEVNMFLDENAYNKLYSKFLFKKDYKDPNFIEEVKDVIQKNSKLIHSYQFVDAVWLD